MTYMMRIMWNQRQCFNLRKGASGRSGKDQREARPDRFMFERKEFHAFWVSGFRGLGFPH